MPGQSSSGCQSSTRRVPPAQRKLHHFHTWPLQKIWQKPPLQKIGRNRHLQRVSNVKSQEDLLPGRTGNLPPTLFLGEVALQGTAISVGCPASRMCLCGLLRCAIMPQPTASQWSVVPSPPSPQKIEKKALTGLGTALLFGTYFRRERQRERDPPHKM